MINAIFDDLDNTDIYLFKYPDTNQWDPNRNTNEFIGNLSLYKSYGLLSFTVGLQGGNPFGIINNQPKNISGQPWINSAFNQSTEELIPAYFDRLDKILRTSDELGMTPIINMFYAAQTNDIMSNKTIMIAINNTLDWFMNTNYTHFMIEVANECNVFDNILNFDNMANIVKYIRSYTNGRYQ